MKPFVKKEKSSGSASEESSSQRPKRSTCQKNVDGSNGLLWREETDLKRALYASLQETRRRNLDEEEEDPEEDLKTPPEEPVVNEQDEILKKAKVHAQRKFAQGSNPNSPMPTPLKVQYVNNSATELLPYKRPKTEDFLTFLCLRGTSILPPSLDFLNCCSKSDTSSECRSLSPDLEVKDYGSQKETTHKNLEPRDKVGSRPENFQNGISRKNATGKAPHKRQSDSSRIVKKTHSKVHKEVSIVRKRKSRDESDDVEFIPPTSFRSKVPANSRTRSSTFNALREKYKKQRIETNKKKLLPPKTATVTQSTNSSGLTTRSQSNPKEQSEKRPSRSSSAKDQTKSASPVLSKVKRSQTERKLALEKRKSLRSAHPSKGFGHKRLSLNKKTMWLRRAKLVPPIVDVDSDSEPEIINSAPAKKGLSQVASSKQEKAANAKRLSERLRNKSDVPKEKSLTPRQILLRKHMQSRLKAKKSALHTKNIKSRTIVKNTAKHNILKRVARKGLVSKTMSLRKDLQNKRVTRSAKHQIEEMLWANPEKRSKLPSSKSILPSKPDKKRPLYDEQSLPKKPKLLLRNKETENKQTKSVSNKEIRNKSFGSQASKMSQNINSSKLLKKAADSAMNTRSSKTPSGIDPKPGCSSSSDHEIVHSRSKSESLNIHDSKVNKNTEHRVSKSGEGKAIKPSENKTNKLTESKASKLAESKTSKLLEGKLNKPIETKISKSVENKVNKFTERVSKVDNGKINKTVEGKGNKSSENSLNKTVGKVNKALESKINKPLVEIEKKESITSNGNRLVPKTNSAGAKSEDSAGVSKINRMHEPSKSCNVTPKVELEDNLKSINNKNIEDNLENNLAVKNSLNTAGEHKETNVQNNLNLQKIDKNLNKDISELISLNVECEESTFIMNCEPSCSGIRKEESDKKLNLDKNTKLNSKLENVLSESPYIKKHNDKKYFKNISYKEEKLHKKASEKNQKVQNKILEKSSKSHKKEGNKESESSKSKSYEVKDSLKSLDKNSQKKELNKQKHENMSYVASSATNDASNQRHFTNIEVKGNAKNVGESKIADKELKKESLGKDNKKLSEKNESGKRPNKVDLKKDSKKLKTENLRNSPDITFSSKNNFKMNIETFTPKNQSTEEKTNKDQTNDSSIKSSSQILDKDSDDDSDYDITLDQYLKLKSNSLAPKTELSSSASTSVENEVNRNSNLSLSEMKDPKTKKESEKDSHKTKKEGESSKHKKDKSSSKDKSCRKEDKSSKKDSEKSLAKLLKRERSKSNKKEEKDRIKHKRDGSSSSKSSKREFEKDGSKLSRKEGDKEGCSSEKKTETKFESFESKKEKSSKKESSKLSRSNSCEETKSPKKKKKHNEFKDIEKIKNLISKSSILNEISGFKEFKRRLSSDKSELKKRLSKSKKRKKLALLKEKKLSKKLSSKLLRKYSKKKGLKKKNKLKKKELKKEKLNLGEKGHSKSKKQKHKTKSDHHKKDNQEKIKNLDVLLSSTPVVKDVLGTASDSLKLHPKPIVENHCKEPVNMIVQSASTNAQTCTNDVSAPTTYVIEAVSEGTAPIETLTTDVSQRIPTDLVFNTNDNYQGLVTSEFSGVFEEPFPTGAILLTTRDSISQVPLHFIQDIPPPAPKTMADAATNTCEDDLEETLSPIPEHLKSEEMSVGTQTMTPVGSPSPTAEMRSIVPTPIAESPLADNHKSNFPKQIATVQTLINLEQPVIPITSQRPTVSNFIHIPPPKPIVSDSVSHILLPVTDGKIQIPNDIHAPIPPGKPKVSGNINIPLPFVTPGTSKLSSTVNVPILPAPPKITNCISKPTSPVTPAKQHTPVCVGSSKALPTPERPKVSVSKENAVTPAKPKVSVGTSNPVTPIKTPAKPRASSSSAEQPTTPKVKKRNPTVKKSKASPSISSTKPEPFPLDSARLVAAPVFYPEAHEFNDPLEYISKIRPEAEQYGICKIVPPASFKPECKVNDDMRFTAHNQFLHKMLFRWGPNVKDTACIRKHLKSQKVKLEQAPLMGGIELDISKFYHTVQQFGGLQQVIEKKKWQKVADAMRVPKTAQDRVTKLYDAYCKYLVSYDLLPSEEKQKIEEEVMADHEKHVKQRNSPNESEKEEEDVDSDENYDCVMKGRSMPLSNFFRIARNTMSMWFKNEPSPEEVEHEFWKIVTERQHHVVVHAGNIDSSVTQSGFPTNRSPFAKHPWNLKVLTNNSRSVLRCMGPLSGITIPTLHVGMLYTTGCWYRDPHSFPWIEYLHTGASKIWYGIPANGCEKFRSAMKKIVPEYCINKPLWLSSDTAMVPPELLVEHGASLSRTIQSSGQFVVIFPESFTSTICCGYCVSESVYFAPTLWLDVAVKAFQDIKNSCESPAFSLERLLFSIGNDPKPPPKTYLKTLEKILPMIENVRQKELHLRSQLNELGVKQFERLPLLEVRDKKKKSKGVEETEQECEVCRTPCYVSMVVYPQEDSVYCLPHAIEHIPKKNLKSCKLKYTYNENDLNELVKKITDLVSQLPKHSAKKKTPKKKVLPIAEK